MSAYPSVDVVIPTRDRPELLRRAIDAVHAQEYAGEVRIIVVFEQREPDPGLGVTAITNTRTPGLAGARNSGILASDGDLVAFCDDDDQWLPGKLAAQVAALRAAPTAVLACCGIRVRYGDTTVDRSLARPEVTLPELLRSRLMELHPSTFLFRRDALLGPVGLVAEDIPGSYAEDYELLLRAARAGTIRYLGEIGVEVLWHRRSYFTARWDTITAALMWLLERYPEFADVPPGRARLEGQIAFARAATGHRRDAVRWARRTLRSNPREARAYLALAVASGAVSADRVLGALHRRGRGI